MYLSQSQNWSISQNKLSKKIKSIKVKDHKNGKTYYLGRLGKRLAH